MISLLYVSLLVQQKFTEKKYYITATVNSLANSDYNFLHLWHAGYKMLHCKLKETTSADNYQLRDSGHMLPSMPRPISNKCSKFHSISSIHQIRQTSSVL
jgi:hypothetical protein